jgi:hypothetical protein
LLLHQSTFRHILTIHSHLSAASAFSSIAHITTVLAQDDLDFMVVSGLLVDHGLRHWLHICSRMTHVPSIVSVAQLIVLGVFYVFRRTALIWWIIIASTAIRITSTIRQHIIWMRRTAMLFGVLLATMRLLDANSLMTMDVPTQAVSIVAAALISMSVWV